MFCQLSKSFFGVMQRTELEQSGIGVSVLSLKNLKITTEAYYNKVDVLAKHFYFIYNRN